jgi:hypothetical protein
MPFYNIMNNNLIQRVVFNYNDRKYGSQSNAYFHVNLPSTFNGYDGNSKSLVYVDNFYINPDIDDSLKQPYNVHIKELVQPNSFTTSTNNMTDIVMTTNSTINTNYPEHKSFPVPVPNDFFQNKMLNVYLTSPTVSFGENLEFPPVALTGNTSTLSNRTYGNGQYTATTSSQSSGSPFNIFDKGFHNYQFTFSFNTDNGYNTVNGSYTGINSNVISGTTYRGEYLTLQMPTSIVLKKYSLTSGLEYSIRDINSGVLAGSTNGTDWNLLDTQSNIFWNGSNETKTFAVSNNTTPYNYYRLLATVVGNSNTNNYRNGWSIIECRLYGEPVYFTDYSLSLIISQ